MFCTKYSKSQPASARVKKFAKGGLVDQINRKGSQYPLEYEIEVKQAQKEYDDPEYNKGQGPTKANAAGFEYDKRRGADPYKHWRSGSRAKKSDD